MAASAMGRVEHARRPEFRSANPAVALKTPPLPFTSARLASRLAIRHVLAEHHDGWVAPHLLVQRGVDQIHHGLRLAVVDRRRGRNSSERGIHAFRIQVPQRDAGRAADRPSPRDGWRPAIRLSTSWMIRCSACRSRTPSSTSNSRKTSHGIALGFLLRAPPRSYIAARRRKASANRGASRGHAPAPVRVLRGNTRPLPHDAVGRQEVGAVHFHSSSRPGNAATSFEILPPAV